LRCRPQSTMTFLTPLSLLGVGAAATVSLLNQGAAHADEMSSRRSVTELGDLPAWSVRLSGAGGAPLPTVHEQLLNADGYSGARWAVTAAVERRVYGHLGVGLLGVYGVRTLTASPQDGGDEFLGPAESGYSEHHWIGAAELPLTFLAARLGRGEHAWLEVSLVPWLGVGFGTHDLHGSGAWRAGPAFGGLARLMFRGRHAGAGLAAGAYTLRIVEPSSLPRSVDFGMILLSVVGGFDVG
jgi:hypothetical protein